MRSRVACGEERPGTSFSTTEMVAGFNPRYSANCFRPMGSFLEGGFFFMRSIFGRGHTPDAMTLRWQRGCTSRRECASAPECTLCLARLENSRLWGLSYRKGRGFEYAVKISCWLRWLRPPSPKDDRP